MSGRSGNKDACIGHTAEFLFWCQGAKMPEAMHAIKFTLEESLKKMKQTTIRRAYTKAVGGKTKSSFPESVDAVTNILPLLPLTQPTPTSRTSVSQQKMTPCPPPVRDGDSIVQKPQPRQIQSTALGMQKWRVKFDAFKRATSWYAKELEKKNGLSS